MIKQTTNEKLNEAKENIDNTSEKNNSPETNSETFSKEKLSDLNTMKEYLGNIKMFNENCELLDYLDSGSESVVYKGLLTKYKKEVILKVMLQEKRERENRREIYISSKLKNQNIINFYGYTPLKVNESGCIMMEYAKHGNLRNFQRKMLKKSCLSESLICYLAFQIINGISYCFNNKIVHLDIKPQNIVIDCFLNAKLIDFSISMIYKDKKPLDDIRLPRIGTNFYIAPEVLSSRKIKVKDLHKVDLYSLGVMLYNLAFCRYPYNLTNGDEENYNKIYEKIMGQKLDLSDEGEYSKFFLDFLAKLLERDITKRMNINQAMNHYWLKGAKILLDEKEKMYNVAMFLSYLITDYIKSFNDYQKRK